MVEGGLFRRVRASVGALLSVLLGGVGVAIGAFAAEDGSARSPANGIVLRCVAGFSGDPSERVDVRSAEVVLDWDLVARKGTSLPLSEELHTMAYRLQVVDLGSPQAEAHHVLLLGVTSPWRLDRDQIALVDVATGAVVASRRGYGGLLSPEAVVVADADDDGFPDVAIGRPYWSSPEMPGCGRVELLSGRTLELLWAREGAFPGEGFGMRVVARSPGGTALRIHVSGALCDVFADEDRGQLSREERRRRSYGRVVTLEVDAGLVLNEWTGDDHVYRLGQQLAQLGDDRLVAIGECLDPDVELLEPQRLRRRAYLLEPGREPRMAPELSVLNECMVSAEYVGVLGGLECGGEAGADLVFSAHGAYFEGTALVALDVASGEVLWQVRTSWEAPPTDALAWCLNRAGGIGWLRGLDAVGGRTLLGIEMNTRFAGPDPWLGYAVVDPTSGELLGYGPAVRPTFSPRPPPAATPR